MQAEEDLVLNAGRSAESGIRGEHGEIVRSRIVPKRRVIVHENAPTECRRVTDDSKRTDDRSLAEIC